MIGIVVVSHSAPLAQESVNLVSEMLGGQKLNLLCAAGAEGGTTFGTDAALISQKIEEADTGDGVLVLVDLGSALMSTEMACEFLDPELAQRVKVSPAPLIEGLTAAAVAAVGGADLIRAAKAADEAYSAKRRDVLALGQWCAAVDNTDCSPNADTSNGANKAELKDSSVLAEKFLPAEDDSITAEIIVNDPDGLHARPASLLAATLGKFDAEIYASVPGEEEDGVDATSLMQLMGLGIKGGQTVALRACGEQAQEALDAARDLAERDFQLEN
ncbi:HPr family phosphocarrier protein [Actinomycetaceae bacterium TAE3-ERU4]|nr:HPr family phosphocarrier protein [Actinomycetaceae bacterium TAE3-ERU4]